MFCSPLPGPLSYDVVDVTRQALANVFADLVGLMQAVYRWAAAGSKHTRKWSRGGATLTCSHACAWRVSLCVAGTLWAVAHQGCRA